MKDRNTLILCRRIMAIVLCAFISFAYMPVTGFAKSEPQEIPEANLTIGYDEVKEDAADDTDDLLMGYINKEVLDYSTPKRPTKLGLKSASRGDRLEGINKKVYSELKAQFAEFANPNIPSTKEESIFTVSAEALFNRELETMTIHGETTYLISSAENEQLNNINKTQKEIINALMVDMPYELFWFDKTQGHSVGLTDNSYYNLDEKVYGYSFAYTSIPRIEANFKVSADYSLYGQEGTNNFDLNRINAVKNTVNTVNNIVSTAQADEYDTNYKKLEFYKDKVCNLTDYDDATLGKKYGDPWQLINVFDGYTTTNVVCEGYSKAFQFLCDKTNFSSKNLRVFTVTGSTTDGAGAGNHMWNIVHMPNGLNYMADITNSDSDSIGYNGTLFMSGALSGGSLSTGYRYDCTGNEEIVVSYTYDEDTRNLYSDSELLMSESDFDGNEEDLELENAKTKAKEEINKIKPEDYDAEDRAEVQKAKDDALAAIDDANDIDTVNKAVNQAKRVVASKKTSAQKAAEKKAADEAAAREKEKAAADDAAAKAKEKEAASNINKGTVTAADIKKASDLGATTITLGASVKKVGKNAFKGTGITTIVVKTKKLKAKSVKGSLKGSKVKTVKVQIGSKKVNKKYVKKYKKFFTKKNAGKKAKVK